MIRLDQQAFDEDGNLTTQGQPVYLTRADVTSVVYGKDQDGKDWTAFKIRNTHAWATLKLQVDEFMELFQMRRKPCQE